MAQSILRRREHTPSQPAPGVAPARRTKFDELLQARMRRVLVDLDYLAQLSVPARYHYTPIHTKAIEGTLFAALTDVVDAFEKGTGGRADFDLTAAMAKAEKDEAF